jgi:hypothetical protein
MNNVKTKAAVNLKKFVIIKSLGGSECEVHDDIISTSDCSK